MPAATLRGMSDSTSSLPPVPPPPPSQPGITPPEQQQPTESPCDYTKSKAYAYVDLVTKVLSALALLALGIAGWHLQSRTEDAHESRVNYEWQQRRYLPMLRSLAELEAELDTIESWIRANSGKWSELSIRELYHRGTAVRYAAHLVFTPAVDKREGEFDPMIRVHYDITRTDLGLNPYVHLPLRASAMMLSDLIRIQLTLRSAPGASVLLHEKLNAFIVNDGRRQPFRMRLAPEAIVAWKAWVGSKEIPAAKLTPDTVLVVLAQDIRFGIAQTAHLAIKTHPDLGEQYVTIRNDVLKNRAISALNASPGQ